MNYNRTKFKFYKYSYNSFLIEQNNKISNNYAFCMGTSTKIYFIYNREKLMRNDQGRLYSKRNSKLLIFTNFSDQNLCAAVNDLGFSDHLGTSITISLPTQAKHNIWYLEKRLFNDMNIKEFKTKITVVNWCEKINITKSVNENYQIFIDTLTGVLDECIPKLRLKIKHNNRKPWLTVGLKVSCKNKRLLRILTIRSKTPVLSKYYKTLKKKVLKKAVNTAKRLQYIKSLNKSTNKTKIMWTRASCF